MEGPASVTPFSAGIANEIVTNYMKKLMIDRDSIITYYAPDATLNWDEHGRVYEKKGAQEIKDFFLNSIPKGNIAIQVVGYDIQTVPETNWTMLVIYGTIQYSHGYPISDYHMTFYVEHNQSDGQFTAFIHYQTFKSF